MKTYWLMGKKGRCASDRSGRISAVPEDLQSSMASTNAAGSNSIIRGYSPVTMDDVARKGAASSSCRNSPIQLALQSGRLIALSDDFLVNLSSSSIAYGYFE